MPISSAVLENPKSDRIRHVADLSSRHTRRKIGRFLVEGPQSVREAVRFMPAAVHDLYVSASLMHDPRSAVEAIAYEADREGIYVHSCNGAVMERISTDCQGIAAVMDCDAVEHAATRPVDERLAAADQAGRGLVAACWQVRDPGNAGTIIRVADAAGCAGVIFVDECVDVTNPKVVRSTAGSLFHLPVVRLGVDGFFGWAAEHGVHVTAADVYGTPVKKPISLPDMLAGSETGSDMGSGDGAQAHGPRAVLFGNEARGLEEGTVNRCDDVVTIPIYGKAESLNVATSAAVLLYAFAMRSAAR
ncbi:MAG: RNA methyltransferase [Bifidobacteriaceae bacterium]|nr:RNA methyltransferase [Bifidobacteriaceae bacterium]